MGNNTVLATCTPQLPADPRHRETDEQHPCFCVFRRRVVDTSHIRLVEDSGAQADRDSG